MSKDKKNPHHSDVDQFDDQGVSSKSILLDRLKIAYVITGGIAGVEAVKNIRELRRFGAEIQVYASEHALKFITPISLAWASGKPPITSLSENAEHIMKEDILLVCPATANIISKTALGIADDLVTTLIAGAWGKRVYLSDTISLNTSSKTQSIQDCKKKQKSLPVLIMVPTMHVFLAANPKVVAYTNELKTHGIFFHEPQCDSSEREKLKTPDSESIARFVARSYYIDEKILSSLKSNKVIKSSTTYRDFRNKILITAGAVGVPLDGVRNLTNNASGETGLVLAKELYTRGEEIFLIYPATQKGLIPQYLLPYTIFFTDYDSYYKEVLSILKQNRIVWGIFTAAVADFKIQNYSHSTDKKISSEKPWKFTLTPVTKVISEVRKTYPKLKMIIFKYLVTESHSKLGKISQELIKEYNYVIANRKAEINPPRKIRYLFGDKNAKISSPVTLNDDQELATKIAELISH